MAKDKSGRNLAVGAIIGAVAGLVTGILTAPKKGIETRRDIKNKAKSVSTGIEQHLKDLYREVSKHYDEVKEQVSKVTGKGKSELDELLPKLHEAKEKLKELLSAVRDGEYDEAHIAKVIKETEAMIKKAAKKVS